MRVEIQLPAKPGHISNLEFVRILTPYVFSLGVVKGNRVLDVGCGFGHGSWLLLSAGAERVTALDLDESRARQVLRLCGSFERFRAFVMDAQRLGFRDESFDVVTCFEVVEHVPRPRVLLADLRRVLKPNGTLLLSTPNRKLRLLPPQRPWNPEHLREYRLTSLQRFLRSCFPSYRVLGVYGDPEPYDFYVRSWRQDPLRVYLGRVGLFLRRLVPASGRRWMKAQLGWHDSGASGGQGVSVRDIRIPPPVPEEWPFYVGDVHEACMDFLAVCGYDDSVVQRAANEIRRAVRRQPGFRGKVLT